MADTETTLEDTPQVMPDGGAPGVDQETAAQWAALVENSNQITGKKGGADDVLAFLEEIREIMTTELPAATDGSTATPEARA